MAIYTVIVIAIL